MSAEITARRRDQEKARVSGEALARRVEDGLAKALDDVRVSSRSMNQYIAAVDAKLAMGGGGADGGAQGDHIELVNLKFQAALTTTDARISSMAGQIDSNLASLKDYSVSLEDRLLALVLLIVLLPWEQSRLH